jgi:hypothetical protein
MGVHEFWKSFISGRIPEDKWKAALDSGDAFSLLYDCNGILYEAANHVFAIGDSLDGTHLIKRKDVIDRRTRFKTNRDATIGEFLETIKEILTTTVFGVVNPTDVLILGFDGIVPPAKLDQQRVRRYAAAAARSRTNAAARTGNSPNNIYDGDDYVFNPTLEFTVGSALLKAVMDTVRSWLDSRADELPTYVYFSDSSEYGEAEHKIFGIFEDLVTRLDQDFTDVTVKPRTAIGKQLHVVAGADSDLCFISMLRTDYDFYWLRRLDPRSQDVIVTNVSGVRDFIVESMSTEPITPDVVRRTVLDFVLVSFLIGDDFVPPVFTLTADPGLSLVELMAAYRDLEGNRIVNEDGTLDPLVFYVFLNLAQEKERELYNIKQEAQNIELDVIDAARDNTEMADLLERKWAIRAKLNRDANQEFEFTELLKLTYDELVRIWPEIVLCPAMALEGPVTDTVQRYRDIAVQRAQELLPAICVNYITGLQWNIQYYLGMDINNWVYSYLLPPCIRNVCSVLSEFETEDGFDFEIPRTLRTYDDPLVKPTQVIFTVVNTELSRPFLNRLLNKSVRVSDKAINRKAVDRVNYYDSYVPVEFPEIYGGRYYNRNYSKFGGYTLVPKMPPSAVFKIGVSKPIVDNYPKAPEVVREGFDFQITTGENSRLMSILQGGSGQRKDVGKKKREKERLDYVKNTSGVSVNLETGKATNVRELGKTTPYTAKAASKYQNRETTGTKQKRTGPIVMTSRPIRRRGTATVDL